MASFLYRPFWRSLIILCRFTGSNSSSPHLMAILHPKYCVQAALYYCSGAALQIILVTISRRPWLFEWISPVLFIHNLEAVSSRFFEDTSMPLTTGIHSCHVLGLRAGLRSYIQDKITTAFCHRWKSFCLFILLIGNYFGNFYMKNCLEKNLEIYVWGCNVLLWSRVAPFNCLNNGWIKERSII